MQDSFFDATVIADSVSPSGDRITTLVATYPRFIHAQMLTHRAFSRNSQSSRAIPVAKSLESLRREPYLPTVACNQRGMSAGIALSDAEQEAFEHDVKWLATQAAKLVSRWSHRVHKQWLNRYLEPWQTITTIITATDFSNFFKLRCDEAAQPEMQKIACLMRDAVHGSTPVARGVHRPFHDDVTSSVAACARVSYLNHEGRHDVADDLRLYKQLAASGHWSPFEHVASACVGKHANYTGWKSLRTEMGA